MAGEHVTSSESTPHIAMLFPRKRCSVQSKGNYDISTQDISHVPLPLFAYLNISVSKYQAVLCCRVQKQVLLLSADQVAFKKPRSRCLGKR